jgi:FkbM family methyltransferase
LEQSLEFQNFLSHCKPDMLLFDIGAHFGIFSLAAAAFGGQAVAIDPSPTATRMIAIQVHLNQFADRIRILQNAVTDVPGPIDMVSSGVFSDGYFRLVSGRSKRELTRVNGTTIDELAHRFGVPTHIKIDVEGHEASVLQGGRATLKSHWPIIFLELHNEMIRLEGGDSRAVLHELAALNYCVFSLNGRPISHLAILENQITRVVAKRGEPR